MMASERQKAENLIFTALDSAEVANAGEPTYYFEYLAEVVRQCDRILEDR